MATPRKTAAKKTAAPKVTESDGTQSEATPVVEDSPKEREFDNVGRVVTDGEDEEQARRRAAREETDAASERSKAEKSIIDTI